MTEHDTVYVRGQSTGNGGVILHTDQACSHLNSSNNVLRHPRDAYPDDQPVCTYCRDAFDPAGGDASGPWEALEEMESEDLATDGGVVEDGLPELAFADQFVESIIYGEKTATVRIDGPGLGLRDRVKATDEDGRVFAILEIRGVATSGVFDVLDILAVFDAEYDAKTPHDVLDGLREHYDEPITPSTNVDIYVFEHARLPGDDGAGGDV